MPSTRPLFNQISDWLTEIESVKTASAKKPQPSKAVVKKANPSGMGETSHPSEDVEDSTHPEQTGSRYEENATDVKRDVPGTSVDETDVGSGGSQDDKQFNIGTNQSATGEDPSVEDDYKSDKDDSGTSHPANADDVGEKYSSMKLDQLLKVAEHKANELLADLANGVGAPTAPQKTAAAQPKQTFPAKSTQTQPSPVDAGVKVASQLDMDKFASDMIAQTIKDADLDADLVGSYLHAYYQTKQAEGEDAPPPEEGPPAEEAPPEEGPPAEGGAPTEGGGGDVLAALGAGGGMGGDPAAMGGPPGDPAAGGMPPGGDPAAAGGPPGAGGGMGEEQALQELVMALQELGISPDELAQMAQGAGAAPGAAPEGAKLASAAKRYKLSGRAKFEEAKSAAQREVRNQIKDYLREITGLKN